MGITKTGRKVASIQKTKNAGWVVSILGVEYAQEGHREDAKQFADNVNARCHGLTPNEVRHLYRLGDRFARADAKAAQ